MGCLGRSFAVALLLTGAAASATVAAPLAAASGADTVISDLEAQGYLVNVNYVNGASKALSQCSVTNVNNPSSSPKPGDTVYVDVTCPNHDDDGGGFGIGVGIG
ncbi:hypothetical protein MMAD_19180 [Mycolicibacterium madagascariense]|uniref:PASTA domain-containing protein n=1 Tax=Mycolicibacterium madagascariense TaxID=212765 RepID=A0A7I7XEB6_9MYCO|nr:hypothetical protein [Mycolicibacterium madagascariense]MCV7015327.1 hypothetical protein [Mycolicibacterium madagascariense]BBZ27623.1 hypothetical protein MMAD_19180 [Mycolicibacterium madagascariense]